MASWSDIHSNSNASVFLTLSASATRTDATHVRVDYSGRIHTSVSRPSSGDDLTPERYIYLWYGDSNESGQWTGGQHIGNANNWDTIPKNFSGSFTVDRPSDRNWVSVAFMVKHPSPRFNPSPYTWDIHQGHLNSSTDTLNYFNTSQNISIGVGAATITTYHQCINIPYTQWVRYSSNFYSQAIGTTFKPADHPITIAGFHHNAAITNGNYPAFAVTGDRSVDLYYERNAVSVDIDANSGSGGAMNWNAGGAVYQNGGTLVSPTRPGYTFSGWTKTGGTFTLSGNAVSNVTASGSVRANWSANTYTLIYDATGGQVSPKSKSVVYDAAVGILAKPVKKGYRFLGWFTTAAGGTQIKPENVYKTAGNLTVYAHWEVSPARYDLVPIRTKAGAVKLAKPYISDGTAWKGSIPRISNGTEFIQTKVYPADFE